MAGATPTPAEVDVAEILLHSVHIMVMSHHHNRNILKKNLQVF
jgi:hypothetical protein